MRPREDRRFCCPPRPGDSKQRHLCAQDEHHDDVDSMLLTLESDGLYLDTSAVPFTYVLAARIFVYCIGESFDSDRILC
jgi:hypothetical protein